MPTTPLPPQPRNRHDEQAILIVGAGVFGLSLAHELASKKRGRGYTNVTVLDRYPPPVPDGSSVDVSRIVRSEYADAVYTRMAREALGEWRREVHDGGEGEDEGGYAPWYSESGFVIIAEGDHHDYTARALEEGRKNGSATAAAAATATSRAEGFPSPEASTRIKEIYPAVQAEMRGHSAVHNPEGGWADAAGSIRELARRAERAGVKFITGERGTVVSLAYADDADADNGSGSEKERRRRKAVGVRTLSGETLRASRVVLAAGAWTNNLVPGVEHAFLATGQPVAFVQLTQEEADTLRPRHPVIVNMSTGVFCFPPTPAGSSEGEGEGNVLKVARHGYGYATTVVPGHTRQNGQQQEQERHMISSPALGTDNSKSSYLPDDADAALKQGLAQFFPQFADRPWSKRRMCWYTDTAKGDFVVDDHPDVEGVFFATGGSGQYVFSLLFLSCWSCFVPPLRLFFCCLALCLNVPIRHLSRILLESWPSAGS